MVDSAPPFLAVGELARRSGVAVSALHFYEARGLLRSQRTAGNQRRFHRSALRRVAVIRVAVRLGIPLSEVAAALARLPDDRTPNASDWRRVSRLWLRELDDRIEQLQRLRDDLTGCIGCGCLSLRRCQLINPEDVLGQDGPGARTLETRPSAEPEH